MSPVPRGHDLTQHEAREGPARHGQVPPLVAFPGYPYTAAVPHTLGPRRQTLSCCVASLFPCSPAPWQLRRVPLPAPFASAYVHQNHHRWSTPVGLFIVGHRRPWYTRFKQSRLKQLLQKCSPAHRLTKDWAGTSLGRQIIIEPDRRWLRRL
jgi:hypothetical protein